MIYLRLEKYVFVVGSPNQYGFVTLVNNSWLAALEWRKQTAKVNWDKRIGKERTEEKR